MWLAEGIIVQHVDLGFSFTGDAIGGTDVIVDKDDQDHRVERGRSRPVSLV